MEGLYRYYSVHRHLGPMAFPGCPETIVRYDIPVEVPGIGVVWGYLEYKEPLDDEDIDYYGLEPAELKTFWVKVTSVHRIEVEAENEKKAIAKACGMAWEYDADEIDGEILEEV